MDEFDDIVFDDYEFDTEITPQPTHTQLNQGSFGNELSFDDTQADNGPTKVKTRKFDEALLLEPEGLRLLRNESRHLLIKGKNHEAGDLKRLMSYYTVWANNLYPKYKFSHFAKAVGKHARGKRVKALVTEWQDEYREKMQVRRNMFSELSGQTVGDEEGKAEESSDDDNQPLFFPMSADVAQRLQEEKRKSVKPKTKKTKYRSNDYIRSDEEDSEDDLVVTKKPRTITFSDDEEDQVKPTNAKSGREYALSILAEKRKQRQLAQQKKQEEEERNKPVKTVDEMMEEYNDDVQLALSDSELAQIEKETVQDEFDVIEMENIDDII